MCLTLDINQIISAKLELTSNHHLRHFSTSYSTLRIVGADRQKYTLIKV